MIPLTPPGKASPQKAFLKKHVLQKFKEVGLQEFLNLGGFWKVIIYHFVVYCVKEKFKYSYFCLPWCQFLGLGTPTYWGWHQSIKPFDYVPLYVTKR